MIGEKSDIIFGLDDVRRRAQTATRKRIAIAGAADVDCLRVAEQTERAGIATCLLIGDRDRILDIAEKDKIRIDAANIVDSSTDLEAARKGLLLIMTGDVHLLMKGALRADNFMRAVFDRQIGGSRRGLLSAGAAWDMAERLLVAERAMDFAHGRGGPTKIAILASLNTVASGMKDLVGKEWFGETRDRDDATSAIAVGQSGSANVISLDVVRQKGLCPAVSRADILVVPSLEDRGIFTAALAHLANAKVVAVVMGPDSPVMMNRRSSSAEPEPTSIALATSLHSISKAKKSY